MTDCFLPQVVNRIMELLLINNTMTITVVIVCTVFNYCFHVLGLELCPPFVSRELNAILQVCSEPEHCHPSWRPRIRQDLI